VRLRDAAGIQDDARAILERERERLLPLLPGSELSLTGGSSVPGALTKGDVDLHLRVPRADFARAVEVLRRRCRIVHPDIWTDGFATFEVDDHPLPTGIAVTALGDEHDELFRRTWQRLASDPVALEQYNEAKRAAEDLPEDEYARAKSSFFASLD